MVGWSRPEEFTKNKKEVNAKKKRINHRTGICQEGRGGGKSPISE